MKKNINKVLMIVPLFLTISFLTIISVNYKKNNNKNTIEEYNIDSSKVNYVAIKIQNNNGNYEATNEVPTSGYKLSDSSYCEVNGVKDINVSMEYKNGKVFIKPKNNTKCYLYFDEIQIKYTILSNKTIMTRTDFSTVLTENTTGKIYTAEDDDGTSYYYAGAVDNNWVKFGGFYWRIVRINGDGTIRLIYNGTTTAQTGSGTSINSAASYYYATSDAKGNDNAYVGYMYGTPGSSTYAATHANTNSSYAKQVVDEWYNTNLNKTGIKEYIDTNAGFCGDRSISNGSGTETTKTYYNAYTRLQSNKTPSLKCINSNDLYTVSSSNKGNKALTYPVGLISADEVAYAGGVRGNSNTSYYLYTNLHYWTMTPYYYESSAVLFNVLSVSSLDYNGVSGNGMRLRPVINLKSNILFKSGTDGTTSKPYEIA